MDINGLSFQLKDSLDEKTHKTQRYTDCRDSCHLKGVYELKVKEWEDVHAHRAGRRCKKLHRHPIKRTHMKSETVKGGKCHQIMIKSSIQQKAAKSAIKEVVSVGTTKVTSYLHLHWLRKGQVEKSE